MSISGVIGSMVKGHGGSHRPALFNRIVEKNRKTSNPEEQASRRQAVSWAKGQ